MGKSGDYVLGFCTSITLHYFSIRPSPSLFLSFVLSSVSLANGKVSEIKSSPIVLSS